MTTEKTVEQIIEELDKWVMLSAAWDCMSEVSKDRVKQKLTTILEASSGS